LQFDFALGEDFLSSWVLGGLAPEGGTPLAQAFLAADVAIAEAGERRLLDERFRVVLLTDGEPNCDGDATLLTELPAKWHERGVETVVLGLPGSHEAAALLDAIAEAGGTHAHQSLGTVSDLNRSTTAASR
jgi:Mg-chelatase subunit ChlD